jgi:hypothetical protein
VPLQLAQQPGGAPLPRRRTAPPGDGVWAGPEPQPSAGRHGRQPADRHSQPGRQQAAKESTKAAFPIRPKAGR